jgi:hypothetical protein
LIVEEIAKRPSTPTHKKWGTNTNLKRNKKKLKKTIGMHNKEAMKSTKRGSKKYLRKKHQKNSQAHNNETIHSKEVTNLIPRR